MSRHLGLSATSLVIVLAAIAIYLVREANAPQPPLAVYADFDTSLSFQPHLAGSVATMGEVVGELGQSDTLHAYRSDCRTLPWFDGPLPSHRAFVRAALSALAPGPVRNGTSNTYLQAVAPEVSAGGPCLVVDIGDGDQDNPSGAADRTYKLAAERIAGNREAEVLIVANDENWPRLKALTASLGTRVHFATPSELDAALILTLAEDARHLHGRERN